MKTVSLGEFEGYKAKLARVLPALQAAMEPGKIYRLRVAHDDWCPHLKGGTCVCDPDFSFVEVR